MLGFDTKSLSLNPFPFPFTMRLVVSLLLLLLLQQTATKIVLQALCFLLRELADRGIFVVAVGIANLVEVTLLA